MDKKKFLIGVGILIILSIAIDLLVPTRYLDSRWAQIGTVILTVLAITILSRFRGNFRPRFRELPQSERRIGNALIWAGIFLIACSLVWLVVAAAIFSAPIGVRAGIIVIPFLFLAAAGLAWTFRVRVKTPATKPLPHRLGCPSIATVIPGRARRSRARGRGPKWRGMRHANGKSQSTHSVVHFNG
jgi:hypothetical protein